MSGGLDLRLRENKGKRLLPHFLEAASLSLDRPVTASDMVSLDETDEVFSRFLSAQHVRVIPVALCSQRSRDVVHVTPVEQGHTERLREVR
jgi:hypothetical protein